MDKTHIFPCEQCGAKLTFSAATGELKCPYCAHINVIERAYSQITENDYNEAIKALENLQQQPSGLSSSKCPSCAAVFELDDNIHASTCPFCGSAVVNEVTQYRPIKPQALLPFKVTQKEAREIFKNWLKSHWFAPNKLKRYGSEERRLQGVYIPYWTYDANTYSRYSGRRGDKYYETHSYMATRNGRSQMQTRRVEKIRWSDVSGDLQKSFDDVLVMATESLRHSLLNWDLENLVDYDRSYLSGYESEVYSITLSSGLDRAKAIMLQRIRAAIKRQIGGDVQEITALQSEYFDIMFKHILLPVYASAFTFEGKVYSYVINGRNGEISGERPYSMVKIFFTILVVIAVASVIYFFNR
jgi:DNA-directed RNA polymerase subunit RPC12/RpoP